MKSAKCTRAILSASMLACVGQAAFAVPSGYDLVWADEFNGDSLDTMKWQDKYPWGRTHNHKAYASPDALSFNGSNLTITATDTPSGNKDFTSGAISTGYSKFRVTEGYIEASIDQPSQPGSWTAFWMLDSGWPPEIDIMEFPIRDTSGGSNDLYRYKNNYHWGSGGNPQSIGTPDIWAGSNLASGYHRYGLRWTANKLEFYLDGNKVREFANSGAISDMASGYLILNYAVGNANNWGGELPNAVNPDTWTNTGNKMKVDWVRVWEKTANMDTRLIDPQGDGYAEWDWDGSWDNGVPSQAAQTVRFGTQGSATQDIEWDKFRATGRMYFDGDTAFTIGSGNESLLFAMNNGNDWSRVWANAGAGGHTIKTRVEVWSNLSVLNSTPGDLTFDGDWLSQARDGFGGTVILKGGGRIILNGDLELHREVRLEGATEVEINGRAYTADVLYADAALNITQGSTVTLDSLNGMQSGEGANDRTLGYLGLEQDKIVLDDGVLVLRQPTNTYRGFTIGAGGATIIADAGNSVVFNASTVANKGVRSNAGGDLTLGGTGTGVFSKPLGGTGGLKKTGEGAWTLGGNNTYTGTTNIEAGELRVHGTIASGSVIVHSGAELTGTGSILGTTAVFGTIRPGSEDGRGTLSTQGISLSTGSILELHLGGDNDYDRLASAGSIFLQGGTTLRVLLDGGYTPAGGSVFDLIDFAAINGVFSTIELPGAVPAWDTSALYTTGQLIALTPGDLDGDGDVDDADFGLAFAAFTGPDNGPTASPADLDSDGDVDDADFGLAFAAFTGPSAPVNIPEPGSGVLIVGGALLLSRRRR